MVLRLFCLSLAGHSLPLPASVGVSSFATKAFSPCAMKACFAPRIEKNVIMLRIIWRNARSFHGRILCRAHFHALFVIVPHHSVPSLAWCLANLNRNNTLNVHFPSHARHYLRHLPTQPFFLSFSTVCILNARARRLLHPFPAAFLTTTLTTTNNDDSSNDDEAKKRETKGESDSDGISKRLTLQLQRP